MTNEELLAKLENATDEETVELLKEFAENEIPDNEELTADELTDVVGGSVAVTSVAAIYLRFNRLSPKDKLKWVKRLKEFIDKVIKHRHVILPF